MGHNTEQDSGELVLAAVSRGHHRGQIVVAAIGLPGRIIHSLRGLQAQTLAHPLLEGAEIGGGGRVDRCHKGMIMLGQVRQPRS